jgi:hypothetical protein
MADTTRGGGGFWTSLPGILTGLAAVIGAMAGLIALFVTRDGGDDQPPADTPEVVDDGEMPEDFQDIGIDPQLYDDCYGESGCEGLLDELANLCDDDVGDACDELDVELDFLRDDCSDGGAYSCDELYAWAEEGSDDEYLGGTCGEATDNFDYASNCLELLG